MVWELSPRRKFLSRQFVYSVYSITLKVYLYNLCLLLYNVIYHHCTMWYTYLTNHARLTIWILFHPTNHCLQNNCSEPQYEFVWTLSKWLLRVLLMLVFYWKDIEKIINVLHIPIMITNLSTISTFWLLNER